MIKTYFTEGILVTENIVGQDGKTQEVIVRLSNEELKSLKANIKIDITPASPFDKYAQEQSLENLMLKQLITFEEYVEALPTDSVMPKQKLEKILKDREEKDAIFTEMQKEANNLDYAMRQAMTMQSQEQPQDNMETINSQEVNNNEMSAM